jgi:hypothetical protein
MKVISLKILLEKGILMSAVKRVVFGRLKIFDIKIICVVVTIKNGF